MTIAYTMISPRVALTTLRCGATAMYAGDGPALVFTQRRTGATRIGTVAMGRARLAMLPPSGLALVHFKGTDPFGTTGAPLASYAEEAALLRDPASSPAPRTEGTRLYVHGKQVVDAYPFGPTLHSERAYHFARQVLALRAFTADRRGTPGDFHALENPSTGELAFYRLRRVEADGTYPAPPSHGQDDHWWEHLGTALPSRQQALAGVAGAAASSDAASAPGAVTPPRGNAP
ncbi:hypothetical protein [Mitsuaria sp. GD03876]|uniref:hypothetical protein n=1 Tax=Mitsuaria sp. GD03876 TaxID=2975399 RepID=UPI0024490F34|nr:hypothetical protein [Mitsuaria sp. GD03876]MDH0863596.1 hypothetical protein [Mitsuaria sp. GD03876]